MNCAWNLLPYNFWWSGVLEMEMHSMSSNWQLTWLDSRYILVLGLLESGSRFKIALNQPTTRLQLEILVFGKWLGRKGLTAFWCCSHYNTKLFILQLESQLCNVLDNLLIITQLAASLLLSSLFSNWIGWSDATVYCLLHWQGKSS
jgi:hypothetical protein